MGKREIVIAEWSETISAAEKRLADSEKCLEMFGEENDRIHIEEDRKRLSELKSQFSDVLKYMDRIGV